MQTVTHRMNKQQGPRYNTGNSIQYPGVNHNERNIKKEHMYVYN